MWVSLTQGESDESRLCRKVHALKPESDILCLAGALENNTYL